MLGRALIIRQRMEGARKTRDGAGPCALVVTDQSSWTAVPRASRDCFQIR